MTKDSNSKKVILRYDQKRKTHSAEHLFGEFQGEIHTSGHIGAKYITRKSFASLFSMSPKITGILSFVVKQ